MLKIQINGNSVDGVTFAAGSEGSVLRGVVINRAGNGVVIRVGDVTVAGCFIGTDPTGLQALGNQDGVAVFSTETEDGSGIVIGGTTPADRNVISGNTAVGVTVSRNEVLLTRNFIGTKATGLAALPNGSGPLFGGVAIIGADRVQLRLNVISGNHANGLFVTNGSAGAVVQFNYFGVGVDGKTPLGNANRGIYLGGAAPGHTIGDALVPNPSKLSGGPGSNPQGNVIANNGAAGVTVSLAGGVICHQKSILGNSIYGNGGLGIDLDAGNNGAADGVSRMMPAMPMMAQMRCRTSRS